MDGFKKLGKSIVSSVTGKGGDKVAADEVLVSCREQLEKLRDQVTGVRSQFTQWAETMATSCEAGVELSKMVENFYGESDHDGRSKSLQHFGKVQEEMANDVFHCIQTEITSENGVCSELDEWLEAIKQIQSQIEDAERARAAAMTTATRLESLEEQYSRKKQQPRGQGSGLFGGLTHTNEQDLEDLSHKITETKTVKESLFKDYNDARTKVDLQVKRIMNERYVLFDRIYVQILESQHDFYIHSSKHVTKFEKAIKYYRKQFPKHGSNENSISHVSHVSHASHASRGSRGSYGSLKGSPRKSQGQLNNNNNNNILPINGNQSSLSSKQSSLRKKYQSVTDLLDFGDPTTNNNNNFENKQKSKNNENNNNNNNNNLDDSKNNGIKSSNSSRSNIESMSDNIGNLSNEENERPALTKENSFDLMAGFGNSNVNVNANKNSSASGINKGNNNNNNNNNNKGNGNVNKKHNKKQESYFDVWGPLINASAGGVQSLFSDSNNNNNNNNNKNTDNDRRNNNNNNININKIKNNMNDLNSDDIKIDNNNNNNNDRKNPDLTEKQQKRANRVAQERYEQIQRQFDIEDKEREERQDAFDKHGSRIDDWEYDSKGVRRNLRTLLIKLPDVLWENSGWKTVNLGSLVNVDQVKKHYRKAVRLVHPDRSAHRGDTTERKAICERIFEGLNAAWAEEFSKH